GAPRRRAGRPSRREHSPGPSVPGPICPDGSGAPGPFPLASHTPFTRDARRDRESVGTRAAIAPIHPVYGSITSNEAHSPVCRQPNPRGFPHSVRHLGRREGLQSQPAICSLGALSCGGGDFFDWTRLFRFFTAARV